MNKIEFDRLVDSHANQLSTLCTAHFKQLFFLDRITFRSVHSPNKLASNVYLMHDGYNLELKSKSGYVQAHLTYRFEENTFQNSSYSFKFISNHEKLRLVVDDVEGKIREYGFRFERDVDKKGWGHPEHHIQSQIMSNPRFKRDENNEIEALKNFLSHIQESFCKKDSFEFDCYLLSDKG